MIYLILHSTKDPRIDPTSSLAVLPTYKFDKTTVNNHLLQRLSCGSSFEIINLSLAALKSHFPQSRAIIMQLYYLKGQMSFEPSIGHSSETAVERLSEHFKWLWISLLLLSILDKLGIITQQRLHCISQSSFSSWTLFCQIWQYCVN